MVYKIELATFFDDDWAEQYYLTKTEHEKRQVQLNTIFDQVLNENKNTNEVKIENERSKWKFWKKNRKNG